MLPRRFSLHRPQRLDEALELLSKHGDDASPYAGGTELLIAMKARVLSYAHIVDLKGLAELKGITARADGGVVMGALATHHELANSALVRERLPAYAELSGNVANIRVRATGTVGGNLCFAEPHADPPAMLSALKAELVLASPRGRRRLRVQEFILGELSTDRASDEVLVNIEVPALPKGARAAYRAFGHLERPAVGVAVVAVPSGKGFDWRLCVGSVCGQPTTLGRLEEAMRGLPLEDALNALAKGAEAAAAEVEADDDLRGSADYKRHLIGVLAKRAVFAAFAREEVAA